MITNINWFCSFLLTHKSVALPALQICLEVFTWTEAEATNKVCSFCGVVLLLAILTNNVELREFVAKDLFSAVIRGLGVESNAIKSPDLVNLCSEIFINLCDRDPAPRQVSFNQKLFILLPSSTLFALFLIASYVRFCFRSLVSLPATCMLSKNLRRSILVLINKSSLWGAC